MSLRFRVEDVGKVDIFEEGADDKEANEDCSTRQSRKHQIGYNAGIWATATETSLHRRHYINNESGKMWRRFTASCATPKVKSTLIGPRAL